MQPLSESKTVLIAENKGKRVFDLTDEELSALIQSLFVKLSIKISLQSTDERDAFKAEIAILKNFIRQNYGAKTNTEITLAFDLFVANKLKLDIFRMLDNVQFSNVMSAYSKYRDATIEHKDMNQLDEYLYEKPYTPSVQELIKIEWQKVQNLENATDLGGTMWQWLRDNKKVTLTNKEIVDFWDSAIDVFKREMQIESESRGMTLSRYIKHLGIDAKSETERIMKIAKELAFNEQLKRITNIDEFLK